MSRLHLFTVDLYKKYSRTFTGMLRYHPETGERYCTKCEKYLPIENFSIRSCATDGLMASCRDCVSKYSEEFYRKRRTIEKERFCVCGKPRQKHKRFCPSCRAKFIARKKLLRGIQALIYLGIKEAEDDGILTELLGYDWNALINHISKQFQPGMTWENYGRGGWSLDHKVPVSYFELQPVTKKTIRECWALSNLQPMWEKDNIRKSDYLSDGTRVINLKESIARICN